MVGLETWNNRAAHQRESGASTVETTPKSEVALRELARRWQAELRGGDEGNYVQRRCAELVLRALDTPDAVLIELGDQSGRQQFDAIMATIPPSTCLHGVPFADLCPACVQSDEFDLLPVLEVCAGAIADAIGREDGLDGEAGTRVLSMIRTAAARARAQRESGETPTQIITDSALALARHDFINRLADDIRSGRLADYRKDVLVHAIVDGLQLTQEASDTARIDKLVSLARECAVTLCFCPEADGGPIFSVIHRKIRDGATLREAIDAARGESPAPVPEQTP